MLVHETANRGQSNHSTYLFISPSNVFNSASISRNIERAPNYMETRNSRISSLVVYRSQQERSYGPVTMLRNYSIDSRSECTARRATTFSRKRGVAGSIWFLPGNRWNLSPGWKTSTHGQCVTGKRESTRNKGSSQLFTFRTEHSKFLVENKSCRSVHVHIRARALLEKLLRCLRLIYPASNRVYSYLN